VKPDLGSYKMYGVAINDSRITSNISIRRHAAHQDQHEYQTRQFHFETVSGFVVVAWAGRISFDGLYLACGGIVTIAKGALCLIRTPAKQIHSWG